MASSLSQSESSLGLPGPCPHPVNLPEFESLDIKARYHSPRCGGDFFDGVALGSRVIFLLTDIAGKRPETQAIAVDVQNVFRARAQDLFRHSDANESESIAELARDVNRALIEAAGGARFAPSFLGCYNLALNILTYHFAGHFLAVFHDAEKTRVIEPCGIPLGLFTHSTYEPAVLAFERHAKLLLLTKGINESRQEPTVLDDARIQLLLENPAADAASLCEAALKAAYDSGNHAWSRVHDLLHPRNQKNRDDLTAVALVRRSDTHGSPRPPAA